MGFPLEPRSLGCCDLVLSFNAVSSTLESGVLAKGAGAAASVCAGAAGAASPSWLMLVSWCFLSPTPVLSPRNYFASCCKLDFVPFIIIIIK